jgi:hypothetical protein
MIRITFDSEALDDVREILKLLSEQDDEHKRLVEKFEGTFRPHSRVFVSSPVPGAGLESECG